MSIDRPMFMNWLTLKKLGTSQNINTGDHMVASSLDFLLHFANIFLYVSLTLSLNVEPCFSVSSFTISFVICQPRYKNKLFQLCYDTSVENVLAVIV